MEGLMPWLLLVVPCWWCAGWQGQGYGVQGHLVSMIL